MKILIEGCVDSVESAVAAQRGGASRLELCANLDVGGTTPSAGLIAQVRARVRLPIAVMIRPRGGSFVHTQDELDRMLADIVMARSLHADAVVVGVLDESDRVALSQLKALVAAAGSTPVVFHRAFDLVPGRSAALETLVGARVARVLTSGGAETALAGAGALADLVTQAAGRITVMAGGKVRGRTVREIVKTSGVTEVHARCETDERQIRAILDAFSEPL
jgi:copper homeostasis protein